MTKSFLLFMSFFLLKLFFYFYAKKKVNEGFPFAYERVLKNLGPTKKKFFKKSDVSIVWIFKN